MKAISFIKQCFKGWDRFMVNIHMLGGIYGRKGGTISDEKKKSPWSKPIDG